MAGERSCVHPFINKIQRMFSEGQSLTGCLNEIRPYQGKARLIYKINVYFVHNFAVSRPVLATIVGYEYLRFKGMPLPNSISLVNSLLPGKEFSERWILKEKHDARHQEMNK